MNDWPEELQAGWLILPEPYLQAWRQGGEEAYLQGGELGWLAHLRQVGLSPESPPPMRAKAFRNLVELMEAHFDGGRPAMVEAMKKLNLLPADFVDEGPQDYSR